MLQFGVAGNRCTHTNDLSINAPARLERAGVLLFWRSCLGGATGHFGFEPVDDFALAPAGDARRQMKRLGESLV